MAIQTKELKRVKVIKDDNLDTLAELVSAIRTRRLSAEDLILFREKHEGTLEDDNTEKIIYERFKIQDDFIKAILNIE